jgi:hypothetical protein
MNANRRKNRTETFVNAESTTAKLPIVHTEINGWHYMKDDAIDVVFFHSTRTRWIGRVWMSERIAARPKLWLFFSITFASEATNYQRLDHYIGPPKRDTRLSSMFFSGFSNFLTVA